ncbi:MAG: cupredoxin domain-containing protein [Acidimicrobiia bacterium]|nr:cupredoxin domain-containing protein [Acidimicrobiia bacterium]
MSPMRTPVRALGTTRVVAALGGLVAVAVMVVLGTAGAADALTFVEPPARLAPVSAVAETAAEGDPTVDMIESPDFAFDQASITVAAGTTVTWANTGERPHTVTDRGGTFDSQPVNPGETTTVEFTAPGTYFYFCRINPSKMNGVVVVEPPTDAASAKVVRVQAVDGTNIEGEQLRFDPPSLEVAVGTQLLFANVGGKPHTLTADDGSFTTPVVPPGPESGRFAGGNAVLALTTPGRFAFHCEIHPQAMKGELVVTGTAEAEPPPPPSNAARKADIAAFDFGFAEEQTVVAPGAEINFRNTGAAPHTLTLDDQPVDTGTIESGDSAVVAAPEAPGSYSFKCTVHPAMRGTLVVLGQDVANPTLVTAAPAASAADAGASGADGDADGGGAGAGAQTAAGPPPAYAAASGSGGGMNVLVLVTAVIGAFLGGVGLTAFAKNKGRPAG